MLMGAWASSVSPYDNEPSEAGSGQEREFERRTRFGDRIWNFGPTPRVLQIYIPFRDGNWVKREMFWQAW